MGHGGGGERGREERWDTGEGGRSGKGRWLRNTGILANCRVEKAIANNKNVTIGPTGSA